MIFAHKSNKAVRQAPLSQKLDVLSDCDLSAADAQAVQDPEGQQRAAHLANTKRQRRVSKLAKLKRFAYIKVQTAKPVIHY